MNTFSNRSSGNRFCTHPERRRRQLAAADMKLISDKRTLAEKLTIALERGHGNTREVKRLRAAIAAQTKSVA